MIANCEGCKYDLETVEMYSHPDYNLHFAGSGLGEKGHLDIVMVNDKGALIIF